MHELAVACVASILEACTPSNVLYVVTSMVEESTGFTPADGNGVATIFQLVCSEKMRADVQMQSYLLVCRELLA